MTTLLPQDEILQLRAIKGAAYTLLIMLRIDRHHPGRAVSPHDVATTGGIDLRTAEKHMQSLSAQNLLARSGAGYILTNTLRSEQRQLNFDDLAPERALETDRLLMPAMPALMQAETLQAQAAIVEIPAQNVQRTKCALKKERIFNSLKDLKPPSFLKSAQNVPTTKLVLEKTAMLFEKPVYVPKNWEDIPVEVALAWVARGFAERQVLDADGRILFKGLYAPWVVVFRGIQSEDNPGDDYLADPRRYLPDEYLIELGLAEPIRPEEICASCGVARGHTAYCPVVIENMREGLRSETDPEPETEPEQEIYADIPGVIRSAWEYILGLLQAEMPKASYDTWVRDTNLAGFTGRIIQVATRNSYARDWLESRMTGTINRMLAGPPLSLGDITVEFLVL